MATFQHLCLPPVQLGFLWLEDAYNILKTSIRLKPVRSSAVHAWKTSLSNAKALRPNQHRSADLSLFEHGSVGRLAVLLSARCKHPSTALEL